LTIFGFYSSELEPEIKLWMAFPTASCITFLSFSVCEANKALLHNKKRVCAAETRVENLCEEPRAVLNISRPHSAQGR
jgi:hypothetical protein